MTFTLYPDPAVLPLTVGRNSRVDAAFAQRAGAPPPDLAGIYAQAMFLRVSMIGGLALPEFFITAGTGTPVAVVADPTPVFRAPGGGFVGDVFMTAQEDNVFQICVGFEKATDETWQLGIRNTHPTDDLLYTWVVADLAADTAQPWVDPAAFAPRFDNAEGEFSPATGTWRTPVTLHGSNFHIGAARVSFGSTPAPLLAPATPTELKVAVPDELQPESAEPITVVTAAGTATTSTSFRLQSRHIVLLGHQDHGIEGVRDGLTAGGFPTVTVGPESFSDDAELVAVVVSCLDGPMPGTRQSVLALGGKILARAAIVITKVELVQDPEIQALVEAETRELLALSGITPMDADQVIKTPTQDVAAQIELLLGTPKRNYHVEVP